MKKAVQQGFKEAVEDHGVEGLEIIRTPSHFLSHAILYIVLALIITIIIWSFYSTADVIIKSSARVAVQEGAKQVYSPADGELVDIFVSEGAYVSEGDVIARIKSSQAIQIAAGATKAKLQLETAEVSKNAFPKKKELTLKELEGLNRQIEFIRKEYDREKNQGREKMSEEQKSKLETVRLDVTAKQNLLSKSQELYQKYRELYNSPGHGGIARTQFLEKETQYQNARNDYKKALADYESLEYTFAKQYLQSSKTLEELYARLLQAELKYEQKQQEIRMEEKKVDMEYISALKSWEAASKINFDDLDENNFLSIKSPVTGEVSAVTYSQAGEKIVSTKPLVSISPENSPKIMELFVPDRDRGFLKEGLAVKLKFNAFSYQRYGHLTGKLQYISNTAQQGEKNTSVYKGRVALDKDYFEVNGKVLPIRFGMTATAEVVIKKRRIIDFALDPFRKLVN